MTRRNVTLVVHKDGDPNSRSTNLPIWAVRLFVFGASAFVILVALAAVLYTPVASSAARVPALERQVRDLTDENEKVLALAQGLEAAEASYQQLRSMLGANVLDVAATPVGSPAVAYPIFAAPPPQTRRPVSALRVPMRWPLDEPGIVTRGAVRGDNGAEEHSGLDVAVPIGTPIRAAGDGVVSLATDHPEYGLYVRLQHLDGFETMYGHASRLLVAAGDSVKAGQVIALSGTTGRSTAPHLHYEVFRGGRSLDPRSLTSQESN